MSRPNTVINTLIPTTVEKETVASLKEIYPDEFIRDYILALMEACVTHRNNNPTKNEKILSDHLKNIELANALFMEYLDEETKNNSDSTLAEAIKNKSQEEKLEITPPATTSTQRKFHFIQESELKDAYIKTYSTMKVRHAVAKIYGLTADLKTLDKAAEAIALDYHNRPKRSTSSHLTVAIYTLVTTAFNRNACIDHISTLNTTQGATQSLHKVIQEQFAQQSEETKKEREEFQLQAKEEREEFQLQVKKERESFQLQAKEEREQHQLEISQLNQSVLELTLHNQTMNESMLYNQSTSFGPANQSFNGLPGNSIFDTSSTNSRQTNIIKVTLGNNRWRCVVAVIVVYNETSNRSPIRALLAELLEKLLLPTTEKEGNTKQDTIIQTWLNEHKEKLDDSVTQKLTIYKALPSLPAAKTQTDEENYYQALGYSFSLNGSSPKSLFPYIENLSKTFNRLRPSKKTTQTTITNTNDTQSLTPFQHQ